MATTTNYSWVTPDDTSLVKDGASAIRSLGTAIDNTVFTNAGAAIAKTIVDAKGDIIAATAADTVSRLAVGANDTVLTADSTAATGLKWAAPASGGMTQLASGSLTGSSVTISSINQTYRNLQVVISNVYMTTASTLRFQFNSLTGSFYYQSALMPGSATVTTSSTSAGILSLNNNIDTAARGGTSVINCLDYANTGTNKMFNYQTQFWQAGYSNGSYGFFSYQESAGAVIGALNSITLATSGTFSSGSYILYGVK
jgi:hypothetical protein